MTQIKGRISQIIGPVIDVYFDTEGLDAEKVLPKIHEALQIVRPNGEKLSSRCSSTSVRTLFAVWPWTIPTDCSVGWKPSPWAHRL